MKTVIISLLFGKDELSKLFTTLLKQRSAVHKKRKLMAKLDDDLARIHIAQDKATTSLKANILSYNDTRAALTKSFDL